MYLRQFVMCNITTCFICHNTEICGMSQTMTQRNVINMKMPSHSAQVSDFLNHSVLLRLYSKAHTSIPQNVRN